MKKSGGGASAAGTGKDSHKYTIHGVPEVHDPRCQPLAVKNRVCDPERGGKTQKRTEVMSDYSWVVVVHHPGTKDVLNGTTEVDGRRS